MSNNISLKTLKKYFKMIDNNHSLNDVLKHLYNNNLNNQQNMNDRRVNIHETGDRLFKIYTTGILNNGGREQSIAINWIAILNNMLEKYIIPAGFRQVDIFHFDPWRTVHSDQLEYLNLNNKNTTYSFNGRSIFIRHNEFLNLPFPFIDDRLFADECHIVLDFAHIFAYNSSPTDSVISISNVYRDLYQEHRNFRSSNIKAIYPGFLANTAGASPFLDKFLDGTIFRILPRCRVVTYIDRLKHYGFRIPHSGKIVDIEEQDYTFNMDVSDFNSLFSEL
jgi:hypothetical protein